MAELTTTAAATAVTGATSAVAAGRPPQEVIVWALMGSLVAVWLDRQKGDPITWRWAGRATCLIVVSVLSGIAGSAGLQALDGVALVGFLAKLERWVAAFLVASLIHKLGPWALQAIKRQVGKVESPDVASP